MAEMIGLQFTRLMRTQATRIRMAATERQTKRYRTDLIEEE